MAIRAIKHWTETPTQSSHTILQKKQSLTSPFDKFQIAQTPRYVSQEALRSTSLVQETGAVTPTDGFNTAGTGHKRFEVAVITEQSWEAVMEAV